MQGNQISTNEGQVKQVIKAIEFLEGKKKEKLEAKSKAKTRNQYKTNWFLYDMNNVYKVIFLMIKEGLANGRLSRNKELLGKYVAFIAVSGSRRNEPFLYSPTITKFEKNGRVFYKITKLNEKNFMKGKSKKRQIISPIFSPKNDKYEKALFDYLIDGRAIVKLNFGSLLLSENDRLNEAEFEVSSYEDKEKILKKRASHITRSVQSTFKAKITNGHKVMENQGVNPHILRHVRAYDLVINKGIKKEMVAKLLGWSNDNMVGYYSDIKNAMRAEEMVDQYLRMDDLKPAKSEISFTEISLPEKNQV